MWAWLISNPEWNGAVLMMGFMIVCVIVAAAIGEDN
jgi:hypothetical protein